MSGIFADRNPVIRRVGAQLVGQRDEADRLILSMRALGRARYRLPSFTELVEILGSLPEVVEPLGNLERAVFTWRQVGWTRRNTSTLRRNDISGEDVQSR